MNGRLTEIVHGFMFVKNENNGGNQVEHLAWLALEADRCEIILALAWHARELEASMLRSCQRDTPMEITEVDHVEPMARF